MCVYKISFANLITSEAFIARNKKSCTGLARTICRIFFARFDKNVTRGLLCSFFLQEQYKILYFLQEKFHFNARLARYMQDLIQEQRHRESGFKGFRRTPYSNHKFIIASYLGSLNTKRFQV